MQHIKAIEQILAETAVVAGVPFEILRERDAESPGPLQEIHVRAAQVVLPPLVPDPLAVPAAVVLPEIPAAGRPVPFSLPTPLRPYWGAILSAPSSLITSPFIIGFSVM